MSCVMPFQGVCRALSASSVQSVRRMMSTYDMSALGFVACEGFQVPSQLSVHVAMLDRLQLL